MKLVFFYGLFMDEELLIKKGLNPTVVQVAYLDGYGLRIGARATLLKSGQDRSYGILMTLNDTELEALYAEPSVADYIPEPIEATDLSGTIHRAYVYNLPESKLSGNNTEYAKSLAEVARKKGLPAAYIEEILRWAQ